jgi:chromosome partitioning protein
LGVAAVIAFVSQKGGVGKSTLARALAREAAFCGLAVKIADLDPEQATVVDWHKVRLRRDLSPTLSVELFGSVEKALTSGNGLDLLVVDAPAKASLQTTEIARLADLLVQPTGASRDDLTPAIRVFHGLIKLGIPKERLTFALNHIGTESEAQAARAYIEEAGYTCLPGFLPERPGYRLAQNEGLSVTETHFKTLRERADLLIQALIDKVAGEENRRG